MELLKLQQRPDVKTQIFRKTKKDALKYLIYLYHGLSD